MPNRLQRWSSYLALICSSSSRADHTKPIFQTLWPWFRAKLSPLLGDDSRQGFVLLRVKGNQADEMFLLAKEISGCKVRV